MRLRPLLIPLLMLCPLLAQGQSVVSGRIVGADGRAPVLAHAHLKESPSQMRPLASTECSADGTFRLAVPARGVYTLELTAVDHQMLQVPLLAMTPEPVALEARLAANTIPAEPESVPIIGDFNEWSFREPRAMTRRDDGTFAITIETENPIVAYQVMFPIGPPGRAQMRSVNGTDAERYLYDGGGDYRSIVTALNGRATITFDPRRVTRSDAPAMVTFADTSSRAARHAAMMRANEMRLARFYDALRTRVEGGAGNRALPLAAESELAAAAAAIDAERDAILRGVAMVSYFTMKAPRHDPALARRALAEIAPDSPLWTIAPSAAAVASQAAGDTSYLERMLAAHPSASLRAQLMFDELVAAHYAGDTVEHRRWFDRLLETFPKDELTTRAVRGFNPDRLVRTGARAPELGIATIDGSRTIDNASLAGRYVFVHFWATWCLPCVEEMKALHAAYDRYGGGGFEIVSLSMDVAPDLVGTFRSSTWPMPWLVAWVDGGFRSELARRYEVQGIPKAMLIDPAGTVVAMDAELRGERLGTTLARFLGTREVGDH